MRSSLLFFVKLFLFHTVSAALLAAETTGAHAVYRSTDRGHSWHRADAGLPGTRINAFTTFEKSVLAGTDTGIFISFDEGESWQRSDVTDTNVGRTISLIHFGKALFAG